MAKLMTPLEDTIEYLKETRSYKAALGHHMEDLQQRSDAATGEIDDMLQWLQENEFVCSCGESLVRELTPTGLRLFTCACGYRICINGEEGSIDETD